CLRGRRPPPRPTGSRELRRCSPRRRDPHSRRRPRSRRNGSSSVPSSVLRRLQPHLSCLTYRVNLSETGPVSYAGDRAMTQAMQELLDILDLEQLEHNLYRGRSHRVGWQRVFGGQVIGQALVAAQRTVEADRHVHSLHCYFMRPGDPQVPIIYQVDRLRDGGSFTTRRVTAIQHGHAIFSLESSFQVVEDGLEHQLPMPLEVPGPETLKTQFDLLEEAGHVVPEAVRKFWARERPL